MSGNTLRATMAPAGRRARAYFAPVDRTSGAGAVFDPSRHGEFDLDVPPSPWIDLGWIAHFRRTATGTAGLLHAGPKGAPRAQVRGPLEARVEFEFREWGKLQMALAAGSQQMNALASDANATPLPSGGSPLSAVAVLAGSTAQEIIFGAGAVDAFAVGDILAIDVDYQQETGYVGSGMAAAYVADPLDVLRDPNYVRRVTFNVGRIASKTLTSAMLAQPLIGGAPAAGASAQKVVAFVDREGGSFFQEWSGLFVLEPESGGRACFYYPRLQASSGAEESGYELEAPLEGWAMKASFVALPDVDVNDGEQVVCYRSYFPAGSAAVY